MPPRLKFLTAQGLGRRPDLAAVSASIRRPVPPIVDLDDIGSWPPAIRDFAEHWASAAGSTTRFAGDLDPPDEAEDSLTAMLGDRLVRAYHSTLLLNPA